jgi:alkylation response protein AidB-like acyl-CoA dehydrogenase
MKDDSAEFFTLRAKLKPFLRGVDGDRIDRDDKVPRQVVSQMKRLGLFGMRLPKVDGGRGLSARDYHEVVAELAAKSAGLAMWLTTHTSLGAGPFLAAAGTLEMRAELYPRLAAGELSALAVTEAGAGTDPSLIRTTARRTRGGYVLDGRKLWVTNGPVARWVVVVARAAGGMTAFVVDARAKGFSVESRNRFLGLRGMENGSLRLQGVRVPENLRLGGEGEGLRLALGVLTRGRLSVAPRALGIARECLRISLQWARARRQHGVALDAHPVVRARIDRLALIVSRLEAVSARAADLSDSAADVRTQSALVKLFSASAACEAADVALQLRGGRGYETAASQKARGEKPEAVERLFRDARGLRIIEGTEDVLRWMIARRRRELSRKAAVSVPAKAYALADAAAERFAAACATTA